MTAATAAAGRVTIDVHDPAICRYRVPWWDALEDDEKLQEADHIPAVQRVESPNTTCVELHEWIVDALDATGAAPSTVDFLAVGRSDADPAESDRSLNDQVDRVDVTSFEDRGTELDVRTFLGEGDANVDTGAGEEIREVGLFAGQYFLNHSLLTNPIAKDTTKTATVTVTLIFTAQ